MIERAVRSPPPSASGRRYSLRSLFFVSLAVAVPFLLVANSRHTARPDDSLASPVYLLVGIACLLASAAIGKALGRNPGMFAAAAAAALCWITLVLVGSTFSDTLWSLLPVHATAAFGTIAVLAALVWSQQRPEPEGPHAMLSRLLQVKSDVRHERAKCQEDQPADEHQTP
jgi:hypothetical protein